MEYLLIAYYYSLPYVIALVAAVLLVFAASVSAQYRQLPTFVFLAAYFWFNSSTYGQISGSGNTLYSRGSGQLFFPFVQWTLMGAVGWLALSERFANRPRLASTGIQKWFWLWFWLLVFHVAWGMAIGIDAEESLNSNGFINMVWMGPFIALLLAGVSDDRSLLRLSRFIVVAGLIKSVFGLVRWAFFGGDPANVYANIEKIAVKLTFFEIGDSLVCLLAAAVCAAFLFVRREEKDGRYWTFVYWLTLGLSVLCIAMSQRRTAWLGLALAFALLLRVLKPAARGVALWMVAPVMFVAILVIAKQRLGVQAQKFGILTIVYDFVGSSRGPESARALELQLAWQEILHSPLVGNGAWGRYAATHLIPWQDPLRPGNFLHSGILHLAMKTGLVGVMLLGGALMSFVRCVRSLKAQSAAGSALVFAGAAGLLFMLPDFVVGTPIPEFRTTQLLALCLALPFVVQRAAVANGERG